MNTLPLYLISFELETQNDMIDLILKPRSYRRYESGENYGKKMPLVPMETEKILNSYVKLCESLGKKPSVDLLKQKFPSLSFVDSVGNPLLPLDREQLEERIILDIEQLKNIDNGQRLMSISAKVGNEGITADVINELSDVTKNEKMSTKYVDITKDLKSIYKNDEVVKGIPTGIPEIDDRTGGLQTGSLNTLAGFAGAGKTTAAVNIAYNALEIGKNVCYLTLEVPKVDMYYNFGSRHSFSKEFPKPISHSIVKKNSLSEKDTDYFFDNVMNDFVEKYGKRLYIVDETDFSNYDFSTIESKLREIDKIAESETGSGIDLVVVDQAQLLKFGGGMGKVDKETSVIYLYVSFFRQQAISFLHTKRTCCVLMLSQINREGYKRAMKKDGEYNLTDLAEANELERASSLVITIYSDESLKLSRQVKTQLLKSRSGATMMDPIVVFMDPEYYVFGDNLVTSSDSFSGGMDEIFGGSLGDVTFNLDAELGGIS